MDLNYILKKIGIIQEYSNRKAVIKKGKRFGTAFRLNPFNPLSYLAVIMGILIGLMLFGIVGFWKEVDTNNPFKWN